MNLEPSKVFNKMTDIVFGVILLALTMAMLVGAGKLFLTLWTTMTTPAVTGKYYALITDVLTLFVLVELSKSLADYFHHHRLRMTFIVDAAIVFFIREIMIMVFQHKASPADLYAISALLAVLTLLRIGSIFMFQREKKIVESTRELPE